MTNVVAFFFLMLYTSAYFCMFDCMENTRTVCMANAFFPSLPCFLTLLDFLLPVTRVFINLGRMGTLTALSCLCFI